MPQGSYMFDIAISFAGEDRSHAEALANALVKRGIETFYDAYEEADLWGNNLYEHLTDVYQRHAHYCVMFLSKFYATKVWTRLERRAAQARAFMENEEYILPIRLDDTEVIGILPTIAFLRWPPYTAETTAELVIEKLARKRKIV